MILTELIARTEQTEQLFTEAQTRGFVIALAASPYMISPEEWIPFLWGGTEQAPFSQPADLEAYCEAIVKLWNQTHEALLHQQWQWPDDYSTDEEQIVNQNVREMCEGLLQGWQLTRDDWENLMPEDSENGALLGGVLLAISMLYDPDTSLATLQDAGAEGLEQFGEIYQALPAMLCGLAVRGQMLAESQD